MAALRQTVQLQRVFQACLLKPRSISTSAVIQGEWDKDWMPAKYPETEAERRAAAKKYGLLPEDYTPLPNDGTGHGDYPQFPLIGEEQKDPYEDWDDPVLKRNFGEPLHIWYEAIVVDKGDPAKHYRYSPLRMLTVFCSVVLAISAVWILSMPYSNITSKYNTWYPYAKVGPYRRGKVLPSGERQLHYTFEPAE